MNTLKMMFAGGGDYTQLAEMLRQFGRGEDKILAHITPEEAAKLKEMGGAGTINPMTGLPEFQTDYEYDAYYGGGASPDSLANYQYEDTWNAPGAQEAGITNQPIFAEAPAAPTFVQQPSYLPPDAQYETQMAQDEAAAPVSDVTPRGVPQTDENVFGRAERGLQEIKGAMDRYPTLTRLGGAGASLLTQALLARRAGKTREAEAARYREMAAPFRDAQAEALARARGEGLTPQQARDMEIAQARARQGLGAGNTGSGSAAAGILATQQNRARSLARQESFDTALKLAGIADDYERRAIAAELAKDQGLSDLFAQVLGREIQAATRTRAPQGSTK